MFFGYVDLAATIKLPVLTRNTSDTPTAPAAAPTYRVYDQQTGTIMTNGTGSGSLKDTGVITGASNATPIVITSNTHKLSTGTRVTVASVGGNTAANGTWAITVINANTFSLDTSVGNGAYTSGGTWSVTGLYDISLTPQSADGYDSGK